MESKKAVVLVMLFLMLMASHFVVGWRMRIYGGREACHNSDSVLIEGFECERVVRNPNRNRDNPFIEMTELNFTGGGG